MSGLPINPVAAPQLRALSRKNMTIGDRLEAYRKKNKRGRDPKDKAKKGDRYNEGRLTGY